MSTVLHAWGFVHDNEPSDVKVAVYEGDLTDIATGVLRKVKSHGHDVTVSSVWSLDGYRQEIRATVTVDPERPIWHRFVFASECWPMEES